MTSSASRSPASRTGGRETEYARAQAAPGLDLIDDRIYWMPPPNREWASPEVGSMLWSREAG